MENSLFKMINKNKYFTNKTTNISDANFLTKINNKLNSNLVQIKLEDKNFASSRDKNMSHAKRKEKIVFEVNIFEQCQRQ
jgi:hypothetical protein